MKILFAERIKYLRTEAEFSQHYLAKKLNTGQPSISHWETGQSEPDMETLWLLADLFDVSVDYLLGREEF
ncbi:MAG: helix-turn-helix transcriptional regulator [Clostridia bacterium]|nr:helix-turn-helix transcriptional regulator [Clostridia bacterium]